MEADLQRAILLAPLAELSHAAFRRLLEEYGAPDLYFTEMLSAPGLIAESPFTQWYLDYAPDPQRTVVQLTGGRAQDFCAAAEKVAAAAPVYGFDVNMGCSVPRIRKRGWGVALMEDPPRARDVVAALRRSFPGHSLSVKMRLGDREDENRLLELGRVLEGEGIDFLTLHPKTSRTVRSRPAKWGYVSRLRQELGIPVVGNGGIAGEDSLRRCLEVAGPGGVMIGRGAVRTPWIFSRLREMLKAGIAAGETEVTPERNMRAGGPLRKPVDIEALGSRHIELITRYLPPEFHVSRARRFFFYFCDNLRFGYRLKMHMQEAPDVAAIKEMWVSYFVRNPEERRKDNG